MTTLTATTIKPTIWQDASPEATPGDIIRKPFCPIARVVGKEILADGRTCLIVAFPGCRDRHVEEWVLPAVKIVPAPTPTTSETNQQPPGRGDGRGRVQPVAKIAKIKKAKLMKFKAVSTIQLEKNTVAKLAKRKTFNRESLAECLYVLANRSLMSGKPWYCAFNSCGYYAFEKMNNLDSNNGYIEVNGCLATKYDPIFE